MLHATYNILVIQNIIYVESQQYKTYKTMKLLQAIIIEIYRDGHKILIPIKHID